MLLIEGQNKRGSRRQRFAAMHTCVLSRLPRNCAAWKGDGNVRTTRVCARNRTDRFRPFRPFPVCAHLGPPNITAGFLRTDVTSPACKRTQPYRRPPPCIYVPVGNHDCGLSHTPWGADWVSGTMSALGQRSGERTYQPMSDFAVCRAESSARVASFSPDIARATRNSAHHNGNNAPSATLAVGLGTGEAARYFPNQLEHFMLIGTSNWQGSARDVRAKRRHDTA